MNELNPETQPSPIGPVPKAWRVVPIWKVLKERREQGRGDLPLLSITSDRGVIPRERVEKRDTSNVDKSKYLRIVPGDIGYNTMRMWQGVSALSHYEGIVSPAYTVCRPTEDVSGEYLAHLFKLPKIVEIFARYSQGLVDDTLSLKFGTFSKLEIPLPPKYEQESIAEIINDVMEAVKTSNELVKQLQALKRGAMHELLTKGMPGRHTAFEETVVGMLPEGWEVRKLETLGRVQAGRQRSPHHVTGQLRPYLRVANVFDGFIDTSDVLEMQFTDKEFVEYQLHPGDILLNEGQSLELVGRPAMYIGTPVNCCFQNTLVRFRSGNDIVPEFALQLFRHFLYSGRFMSIAKKTTSIAHLGVSRFAALRVALPSLAEQQEIVEVLVAFDGRIQVEQERLRQLEQVKAALAQQLLSGKLSVPDLKMVVT